MASVASRLASSDYIRRMRRGVYSFVERESLVGAHFDVLCQALERSLVKTFGKETVARLGIESPEKCDSLRDLRNRMERLRAALGVDAANRIVRVVAERELAQRYSAALLRKLDI